MSPRSVPALHGSSEVYPLLHRLAWIQTPMNLATNAAVVRSRGRVARIRRARRRGQSARAARARPGHVPAVTVGSTWIQTPMNLCTTRRRRWWGVDVAIRRDVAAVKVPALHELSRTGARCSRLTDVDPTTMVVRDRRRRWWEPWTRRTDSV